MPKQGSVAVSSKIFLWSANSKIVVSDVDGTITKSDVMGHVSYMLGRDWTHKGVAQLFSKIKVRSHPYSRAECPAPPRDASPCACCVYVGEQSNGYNMVYLTSRAIGQTEATKTYLENISQGDVQLPAGPVITSPDRLFTAFKREVIDRQPQVLAPRPPCAKLQNSGVSHVAGGGARVMVVCFPLVGVSAAVQEGGPEGHCPALPRRLQALLRRLWQPRHGCSGLQVRWCPRRQDFYHQPTGEREGLT